MSTREKSGVERVSPEVATIAAGYLASLDGSVGDIDHLASIAYFRELQTLRRMQESGMLGVAVDQTVAASEAAAALTPAAIAAEMN